VTLSLSHVNSLSLSRLTLSLSLSHVNAGFVMEPDKVSLVT